jgi:hypothetical protein
VNVKKLWGVAALILGSLLVCGPVSAMVIPGLYDTGQGAAGSIDPNYLLTSAPVGVAPAAVIIDQSTLPGSWYDSAGWIGVNDDDAGTSSPTPSDPAGLYIFRLTFDLTGFDLSSVLITGNWATDNSGVIYVNGGATDQTSAGFGSLTGLSLDATDGLVAGLNTLAFHVTNLTGGSSGNPMGLLVEDLAGTGRSVPEPSIVGLMAIGLLGIGFARRQKPRG